MMIVWSEKKSVVGYKGNWAKICVRKRKNIVRLEKCTRKNIFMESHIATSENLFGRQIK